MTKPNVEFVEFEPALEVAPQVMEWNTATVRHFDLVLPASYREHAVRIDMQPLEITDERAIVTITTNLYTIVRRRRWFAVGQCASLLTLLVAVPVIQTIWSEDAGEGLRAAIAGALAGFYLIPAAIKHWRG